MKKAVIVLLGCLPFLLGRAQDWAMMHYWPPLLLISCLMLLLWGGLSSLALKLMIDDKKALLLLNTPAIAVLLLILVQEWGFGAYWSNGIGLYSQLFFLPLLSLGYRLTFWSTTVVPAYVAAFLLMALTSFFIFQSKKS